jgi:hypothetical protein
VQAAFGVVMDGTRASPTAYTGRIGVPAFLEIGKIVVLRFATAIESGGRRLVAPAAQGEACHLAMTRGRFVATGGDPAERSEIAPTWLIHPERLACGRLEDTRRAKCLIDNDGFEMKSAHLACFAWRTPQAASELIQAASRHAAGLGLPALFVAVSERDMLALETALGPVEKVIAPATVYGAGLPGGADWNINSSEI